MMLGKSPDTLFADMVAAIRSEWPRCRYDHKPHLPDVAKIDKWRGDERFRATYAAFKYTVAAILQPKSIIEIGVGFAVAAKAFLIASPKAWYTGYDDGSMDSRSIDCAAQVLEGHDAHVERRESSRLTHLAACDLVHVDGAHDYGHALHDTALALRAARWVLIDDCRDSQVAAGALTALFAYQPGDCRWAYFHDTWGGDILAYTGVER